MPRKLFICPDGQTQLMSVCLAGDCRMNEMCAPFSYLAMCATNREWKGIPSTTQLINGTRYEYLKLTCDYAIKPENSAFMVIGTSGHKKLEGFDTNFTFLEEKFKNEEMTGVTDALEWQPQRKTWWLVDYKTIGSYKVTKVLGIKKTGYDVPIVDDNGEPVQYKTGKRAGQAKTKKEYKIENVEPDHFEYSLQLNRYRMFVEHELSEKVEKMMLFILPRDANTYIAKQRGIMQNMYYVEIPKLDDSIVVKYFAEKREALLHALENKKIPTVCSAVESWDGNRCRNFCDVSEFCKMYNDNPYLSQAEPDMEEEKE